MASKLLLGGFVFTLAFTYSCKEDPKKENEANLIGTWVAVESTLSDCQTPDNDGVTVLECTEADCLKLIVEKDSLGSVYSIVTIASSVETGSSGSYSVGETRLTLCEAIDEDEVICDTYKMDVSKTSLTLTIFDVDIACEVVTRYIKEE